MLKEDLEVIFTYHKPKEGQPEKYVEIRDKAKELATLICDLVPDSYEKTTSIRKIEEAVMWANAGIARR